MLKIIHGTELIPVEHPIFLLFAQPGFGKSTLGYSMADALTLDFDKGAHRAANRRDTLVMGSWADFEELLKSPDAVERYRSFSIDTVGAMLDAITADIAKNDPKKAPGGSLTQQGYGALKGKFRAALIALRAMGKDVLLIAHDKEDKDGDTRIVRPDIIGGSLAEVLKISDFCAYGYISGKERILDFNPTDRWVGKNPAGWEPFKVPALANATAFMADLYDRGRKALGGISGESAQVLTVVEEWRAKVEAITTPEQCSAAIEPMNVTAPIVMPQIKKLLADRAKVLGFVFDKTAKRFVVAPKADTATSEGSANFGMHGLALTTETIEQAAAVAILAAPETDPKTKTRKRAAEGAAA